MRENIKNYICSLNWSYRTSLKKMGVTYINNKAVFNNENKIEYISKKGVKNIVNGKYYVIATGGRPIYLIYLVKN